MKPWIMPAALALVLAAAVTAGSLVSAQPLPESPVGESDSRVSVVCPAPDTATADVRVAAVAVGETVRTSKLSTPRKVAESNKLVVVENPRQPMRVSVKDTHLFGATSISSAPNGPSRGLAASGCASPQSEHWFTGVDVSKEAQADLILVNLDSAEAVVDLVAYGPGGRLNAPRGVSVKGGSQQAVPLSVIDRTDQPITLKVTTSQGRVAAFLRQFSWNRTAPYSSDWVPDGLAAATNLVLPGIPAGGGSRTLVVSNPGELTAGVDIDVLSPTGLSQLSDAQRIDVPPATTQTIELAPGLDGEAAGVRLTSNLPVTAAVLVDNGRPTASIDSAVAGYTPPLPSDAVWPVSLGTGTTGQLQLVNAAATDATVTLSIAKGTAAAVDTTVTVPAESSTTVALPKTLTTVIRIRTDLTLLYGSVVATSSSGGVKGIAVLDLVASEARSSRATIAYDPHLS